MSSLLVLLLASSVDSGDDLLDNAGVGQLGTN